MLTETFLKICYCHKDFDKNKIEILPYFEELGPNFHIWAHWSKIKKTQSFSSLNFLMLSETILEMPYYQLNFGKNRLEILSFWGDLAADFHIWPTAPKWKIRPLTETLWSSWSIKYLVGFLLPRRNKLYDKKPYFS